MSCGQGLAKQRFLLNYWAIYCFEITFKRIVFSIGSMRVSKFIRNAETTNSADDSSWFLVRVRIGFDFFLAVSRIQERFLPWWATLSNRLTVDTWTGQVSVIWRFGMLQKCKDLCTEGHPISKFGVTFIFGQRIAVRGEQLKLRFAGERRKQRKSNLGTPRIPALATTAQSWRARIRKRAICFLQSFRRCLSLALAMAFAYIEKTKVHQKLLFTVPFPFWRCNSIQQHLTLEDMESLNSFLRHARSRAHKNILKNETPLIQVDFAVWNLIGRKKEANRKADAAASPPSQHGTHSHGQALMFVHSHQQS